MGDERSVLQMPRVLRFMTLCSESLYGRKGLLILPVKNQKKKKNSCCHLERIRIFYKRVQVKLKQFLDRS